MLKCIWSRNFEWKYYKTMELSERYRTQEFIIWSLEQKFKRNDQTVDCFCDVIGFKEWEETLNKKKRREKKQIRKLDNRKS